MWSSSPVCARPVRTFPRSPLNAWMVLSIFCSVVFFRSAITMAISHRKSYVNQRAFVLAQDDPAQCILLEDAEDVDRQLLVTAQRQRGRVHHLEVAHDRLVEADAREALRARIALRIGGVDAVALGRLDHDLGAHLAAAQRRCRVGREKGIGGSGGEKEDLALLPRAGPLVPGVRVASPLEI